MSKEKEKLNRKKKIKARVYERDGRRCLVCGRIDHLTIDHIVPLSLWKNNSHRNMQVMCGQCNVEKGVKVISYRTDEGALSTINKYLKLKSRDDNNV
uniref:Putative homing endonuclease n=1 Tax=viral metagenome TaxID=1070528 RepID=A0A6H1ZT43_9ZZZZ